MDLSLGSVVVLFAAGLLAGFINAVAGGGSLLTIPALVLAGLPWDIANATNRVGVWFQAAVAARTFRAHGHLDLRAAGRLLLPALVGAGAGAGVAAVADPSVLRPVIIAMLVLIGTLMALRPRLLLAPPGSTPLGLRERPSGALWLLLAGFYGGFLQAGVGYFLLAVVGGVLRFDLVGANAIKVLLVGGFTTLSLVIFAAEGMIEWGPGLLLAAFSAIGSWLGAHFAVRTSQRVLRWVVLATLVATLAAVLLR